jgi:antitoxin (DNA-binding transcriptional repressor) of toxin-antitoxin stability system
MVFHMKTASVRDLRQDFPRILAWIEAGEEVAITMRRQAIARLVPWPQKKQANRPMPDIANRLKRVFGTKIIPDETMKRIIDRDRGKI